MTDGDERQSRVARAAGRLAFTPMRAAARAVRGPLEGVADDMLSAPEVARVIDHVLAGPLPEDVVESLVANHVIERIVAQAAANGEIERLVIAALDSPNTLRVTDEVLASEASRRVLRHITTSPELRAAIAQQTTGLADEVVGEMRASAVRLDTGAERLVLRPRRAARPAFAGVVSRGIALSVDAIVTLVLFMSLVGVGALLSSMFGGLRPQWLVATLLASGWSLIAATYLILFWTTTGQTPGMRVLRVRVQRPSGARLSFGRALVRFVGLVLSIIPMFAGFVPVLFTERRRGLADFLAGTVVVYSDDDSPARV